MLLCEYCSAPVRKGIYPIAVTASESELNGITCENCGCFCEDLYEFDVTDFREKDIESKIIQLIENNSYIEADEDDTVLFPEVKDVAVVGYINNNHIILDLKDGTEVHITVKAYSGR